MSEMDAGLCNAVQQGARQYFQGRPAQHGPAEPNITIGPNTGDPSTTNKSPAEDGPISNNGPDTTGTKTTTDTPITNSIPSTGIGPDINSVGPTLNESNTENNQTSPVVSNDSIKSPAEKTPMVKINDTGPVVVEVKNTEQLQHQDVQNEDAMSKETARTDNSTDNSTSPVRIDTNPVEESQKPTGETQNNSRTQCETIANTNTVSVSNNMEPECNSVTVVVSSNSISANVTNVNTSLTNNVDVTNNKVSTINSDVTNEIPPNKIDITNNTENQVNTSTSSNIVCTTNSIIVASNSTTVNTNVGHDSSDLRPISGNSDNQNLNPTPPSKPSMPLQNVWRPPTPINRTIPTQLYGSNNNTQHLLRYDHSNDSGQPRLLQHGEQHKLIPQPVDNTQQKMSQPQYGDMKVVQQQQQHNDAIVHEQRLQQYNDAQRNDNIQHNSLRQPHIVQYNSGSIAAEHQRTAYSNPPTPVGQQHNNSTTNVSQQNRNEPVLNNQQSQHLYNNATTGRPDMPQQQPRNDMQSQHLLYAGNSTPESHNVITSGNLKRQHESLYSSNRVVYANTSNNITATQRVSTYTPATSKQDQMRYHHRSELVVPNNGVVAPKHQDPQIYSTRTVTTDKKTGAVRYVANYPVAATSNHNTQQLYHVRAPTPKPDQQYPVKQHEPVYPSGQLKHNPGYNPQQDGSKLQHSSPHIAHHVSQQYVSQQYNTPGTHSSSQNLQQRHVQQNVVNPQPNAQQLQNSQHGQYTMSQQHANSHHQSLQQQHSTQSQHQMYQPASNHQAHIRSSSHSPAGSRTGLHPASSVNHGNPAHHPSSAPALHSAPANHEQAGVVRAATSNTTLLTGGLAEQPIEQLARPASLESDRSTPRARPAYPPQQAQQYSTTTTSQYNTNQKQPPQQQRYISQQQPPPSNTTGYNTPTTPYQQPNSNKTYHQLPVAYKNNTKTAEQQQPGQYQQSQYQYPNKVSSVKTVYPGVYQQPEQHVVVQRQQQQRVPQVPQQQQSYSKSQQAIPVSQAQYHQQLYANQQQAVNNNSNSNSSSNNTVKSSRDAMHKLTTHRHRSGSVVGGQQQSQQYPLTAATQQPRYQYNSNQTVQTQNIAQHQQPQTRVVPPPQQQQQTRVVPQQQQQQPLLKCNSVTSNTVVNATKRESPLDLSVKTVRTSADSTAKDDSNSNEQFYLQQHQQQQQHESYKYMRASSQYPQQQQQQRLPTTPVCEIRVPVVGQPHTVVQQPHTVNNTASHKVDFLPKFNVSTLKPSGDYVVRSVAQQQQQQYARQHPSGSVIQQHLPHKNIGQQHPVATPMKHAVPLPHPVQQQQHGVLPVHRKRAAAVETQIQQPSKIQRLDAPQHPAQHQQHQHPSLQHPPLQQHPAQRHQLMQHSIPQHTIQQYPTQHHPTAQHQAAHPAQQSTQHPVVQQHPQPIQSPQKHPDYAHYRLPSTNVYDVDAQRYMNYAITPLLLQQQPQQPTNNIARHTTQQSQQQQQPSPLPAPYNAKNAPQSGADKRILNLLRSSLESKEAERARLDKELKAIENNRLLQQQQLQQLQKQTQNNTYERQVTTPSVYKLPRAVDSIRFEVEDHNQNDQLIEKSTNKSNDESGIAALLAARIRTKAELKGFTQQQQLQSKTVPEKTVAVVPRKRVFSKTDDDDVIIIDPIESVKNHTPAQLPARDKSGLRSSSETSVYDFRDSESETEMPVLERQSLDDLRKDRRNSLCNGTSKTNEGNKIDPNLLEGPMPNEIKTEISDEPVVNAGDNIWSDVCEQFVEELITGVKKRRGRRKKVNVETKTSIITECTVSLETVTMEKPLSDIKIEQDLVVNLVDIVRSENKCYVLLNGVKQEKPDEAEDIDDKNTDKDGDKSSNRTRNESTTRIDTDSDDSDVPLSKHLKNAKSGEDKISTARKEKCKTRKLDTSSSDDDSDNESSSKTKTRLRARKHQNESNNKTPVKDRKMVLRSRDSKSRSPSKATNLTSAETNTSDLKPNRIRYGDGSDFYPGWEQGVYKYKQSLRMPARLISVTRLPHWPRLSTSLPDLDPCPNSPTPSSIADINECTPVKKLVAERIKRHDESDQDSNSSFNCAISEASSSTIYSSASKMNKKENNNSIVDVLIQKYGNGNLTKNKKRKSKTTDLKTEDVPKVIPKTGNAFELLATPSPLGKNDDSVFLGTFRKQTITNFRDAFLNNTGGRLGATEEFAPTVYKSRTRTETRVLRQRATIREVFGEDRPASAPPMSRHGDESEDDSKNTSASTSITSKSVGNKTSPTKNSVENMNVDEETLVDDDKAKTLPVKKKLKWRSMRRKFSSGFDYIRKKKKIIRKDESETVSVDGDGNKTIGKAGGKPKRRGWFSKPNPESVIDIQKEIKGWVMNKGVGETHLHRAARLGYTDVTAYCLEKLSSPPSPRDNAGYTPLHEACSRGHLDIARLLLQYGAGVSDSAHSGIRPLHEAAENGYVEIIRLLLSYGADPLLATYSGQTPLSLATDEATIALLRDHLADVQGDVAADNKSRPWCFTGPAGLFENKESGFNVLEHPPSPDPPPEESDIDVEVSDHPLPPLYSIKGEPPTDYWVLLQDLSTILKIKSKDTLLKQINPSQSPSVTNHDKAILKEFKMADFLEKTTCSHLMCAGEKINIRSSKITMVKYGDKVKQLLGIEKVAVTVR